MWRVTKKQLEKIEDELDAILTEIADQEESTTLRQYQKVKRRCEIMGRARGLGLSVDEDLFAEGEEIQKKFLVEWRAIHKLSS